jgi:excisionase family DNA binding protein
VAVARHRKDLGANVSEAGLGHHSRPRADLAGIKPLLSASELALILNTSRAAIYAMHARGKLPGATKVGRRVLFRRDALLRWLAEGESRR